MCLFRIALHCSKLTSLVTPFDVLKTRLQTAQPPRRNLVPPAEECCQTTVLTPSSSRTSYRIPASTNSGNPLTCYTSAAGNTLAATSHGDATISSLRSATTAASPPEGCLQPTKWAGIWGDTVTLDQTVARGVRSSGGGSASLALPAEQGIGDVMGGFWDEVAAVRRETGIRGLWKGVGTTLWVTDDPIARLHLILSRTMSIPSAAIYMLGYEHLLAIISPRFTGSNDPAANMSSLNRRSSEGISTSLTPAPLIAGSMARTFSATVISPIEMFRTRLQALPSGKSGSRGRASGWLMSCSWKAFSDLCVYGKGDGQAGEKQGRRDPMARTGTYPMARRPLFR